MSSNRLTLGSAGRLLRRVLRRPAVDVLPVYRYLDLSTAHTRPGELEALTLSTTGARGPHTIPHKWGAWVNVPVDDEDDRESLDAIRERCPAIVACLRYASELECTWVNFDADAGIVQTLARFEDLW